MTNYAIRKKQRYSKGICENCARPRVRGKVKCEVCLCAVRRNVKRDRLELIKNGLCIFCRKPNPRVPLVMCQACNDRSTAYNRQYVLAKRLGTFKRKLGTKVVCEVPTYLTEESVRSESSLP